jgi:hypothetical protein
MIESHSRKARVSVSYTRIYPALAVVALSMSFLPLYATVHTETLTTEYGSVWQMAGRDPVGIMAAFFLVGVVAIFVVLNFRPPTAAALPFVGAAANAVAFLGIILKPGTGTPSPALAQGGIVLSACALMGVIVCVAHGIHLSVMTTTDSEVEAGASAPDGPRRVGTDRP